MALDYVNQFTCIVEVRVQEYFDVPRVKFTIQVSEFKVFFVIPAHYGTNYMS